MTRTEKISLLKRISEGKEDITTLIIKNDFPLPSWYWQQFETDEELLKVLKRERGQNIRVIWHDGKPYSIDNNPPSKKFNWFGNEK